MEVLFLWFLPMIFGLFLAWFCRKQFDKKPDMIVVLMLTICSFVPVLSIIANLITIIVLSVKTNNLAWDKDSYSLKNTKFNRFLFENYFKN